jgi:hypothetical protein
LDRFTSCPPHLFERITQVANTATALQVNLCSGCWWRPRKVGHDWRTWAAGLIALAPDVGDLLLSTPTVCHGYNQSLKALNAQIVAKGRQGRKERQPDQAYLMLTRRLLTQIFFTGIPAHVRIIDSRTMSIQFARPALRHRRTFLLRPHR